MENLDKKETTGNTAYHGNKRAEEWRQALAEAIENTRKDTTLTTQERYERIEQYRKAMETTGL